MFTDSLLRAGTTKKASKPAVLMPVGSKTSYQMSFINYQISGALRQTGKKASMGLDKPGILPLSPRDDTFPPSEEIPTSSFRAANRAMRVRVKEKTQLPG